MTTKKRQQYTAEFKAKVVLESLQRDTTIEADHRGTDRAERNPTKSAGALGSLRAGDKVELATHLTAPNGPYSKSQVARALSFARSSYYLRRKQAKKDKAVAVAIEVQQEQDDTMGHRKLAALLHLGKNRIKRVMQKDGLTARRKKKRYIYPGKAAQIAPNLVRELKEDATSEVVFSDIFAHPAC